MKCCKTLVELCSKETTGVIKFNGNDFTLLGDLVKVGDTAPDFTAINTSLAPVTLSEFKGKMVVLTTFPSIDTTVCATQARTFNKKLEELNKDVVILSVSKDLPFALGRFCAAEGIKNIHTLSDYRNGEVGLTYGVMIKELMLLTRSVIVIDENGVVKYVEIVPEVTAEPNYDAALEALK